MTERTVLFGREHNLVATLTEPSSSSAAASTAARYALVLTNVGIMPRCGPYRMNVEIARRFAALGVPSIRFDQGGLGDSARSADPLPHHQQRVAETRAALDEAQRAFGVDKFVMLGVCAGADIAYLTAPEEPRLRGLVMFDPYLYPNAKAKRLAWQRRFDTLGAMETGRALSRSVLRRLRPAPASTGADAAAAAAAAPLKYG
ncbi:MAG TPA: alpha/beta hydrolase, partial [Myxococcota bacterium]